MAVNQEALDQLFVKARTHHAFTDKPVSAEILRKVYDIMKYGATSTNCCPMRIAFVQSSAAKDKLVECLDKGNVDQTRQAPVTAIIAYDMEFYEMLPKLVTHTDARPWFAGKSELIKTTAFRNGSLQGAYFMIAARSQGLDCGPMSGFDNAKVDAAFFEGTSWKSNFLCNLGYGDASKLHGRAPRLTFEEACEIV